MNVAVCAALADWRRIHYEPEALLQIAMNVEAQAINVPTGLQDYRPALYGGIAALELEVDGVRRVPLDVDLKELQRRIVLCYTGEPRNSGTNNWDITKKHIDGDPHIFDCFERIRDTAATMRTALTRGDWDGVGTAIAERVGKPEETIAGGDHPGHRAADHARSSGWRNGGKSLRRGGRRVSVLLWPSRPSGRHR